MRATSAIALKGRREAHGAVLAAAAGLLALPSAGLAQGIPQPTREELDPGRFSRPELPAGPRLSIEGGIERGPCPFADGAYAGMTVNFSSVDFANPGPVTAADLAASWSEFAGRDVPLATICEVRDRAATMLRQRGYLAAVQVPPQRIDKGGTVRLDILTARLVDVQARGETGHSEKLIAAHLARLSAKPYFNTREAERQLLLLRDLPGYDVRLVLRPTGTAPGEVTGEVSISRQPYELIASVQNLATRETGRFGGFVQFAANDLIGLGDRTAISLYNSAQLHEQTVLQLQHDLSIGADGLRLGGKILHGWGRPDVLDGRIRTRSLIGQLTLSYPFVRRQTHSLYGSGGVELINQAVNFAGAPLSRDRLRVLFGRVAFDAIDGDSLRGSGGFSANEPRWRAGAGIELRQGIAGLGASRRCKPVSACLPPNDTPSNLLANPAASVVRLDGAFEYRPVPQVTFAVSPRAQYTRSQLLGYEQFSLGNYTVGRGFDPGIVQGDIGVGAMIELRAGRLAPRSQKALAWQPYAFFDAAWAWSNDGGLTNDPRRLLSAGGGVRARWGDHADFNMALAVPLEKAGLQARRGDVRLLFSLTTRIIPWLTQ